MVTSALTDRLRSMGDEELIQASEGMSHALRLIGDAQAATMIEALASRLRARVIEKDALAEVVLSVKNITIHELATVTAQAYEPAEPKVNRHDTRAGTALWQFIRERVTRPH